MNNNKETLKEQEVAENSVAEREPMTFRPDAVVVVAGPTIEGYVPLEDDGKRHWPDPQEQLELVPVDLQQQHRERVKQALEKATSKAAAARHRRKAWPR
jgi:hypothetical protein